MDPFTLEELRSICEDDRLGVWTSDDRSGIHSTLHALPSRRLRSSWKMAVVSRALKKHGCYFQLKAEAGQGGAKGGQGSAKGGQRATKGRPRGGQGEPKGSQRDAKGGQGDAKGGAKGGQRAQGDAKEGQGDAKDGQRPCTASE